MLYKGLPPDPNHVRRHKPMYEDKFLARRTDRKLLGPNLPDNITWSDRTKEWWKTWRRSEIAAIFEPSDWESLLETAVLHNMYWSGDLDNRYMVSTAAEIRRRVAAYGATYEDRLKLRLKFAPPPEGEEGTEQSTKSNLKSGVDYKGMFE